MEVMNPIAAVRKFLEEGSTRKIETREMMDFWKACSTDERKEYAASAAKSLGVQLATVAASN